MSVCLGEGQSRRRWLCLYVVGRYKYTHTTVMSVMCVWERDRVDEGGYVYM